MHHRLSNRKSVNLRLRLYQNGNFLGEFCTGNVSNEGVFIEANNLNLKKHVAVAIEFYDPNNGWIKIPAIVSHKVSNGAGIMFCSKQGISLNQLEQCPLVAC